MQDELLFITSDLDMKISMLLYELEISVNRKHHDSVMAKLADTILSCDEPLPAFSRTKLAKFFDPSNKQYGQLRFIAAKKGDKKNRDEKSRNFRVAREFDSLIESGHAREDALDMVASSTRSSTRNIERWISAHRKRRAKDLREQEDDWRKLNDKNTKHSCR